MLLRQGLWSLVLAATLAVHLLARAGLTPLAYQVYFFGGLLVG